MVRTIAEQHGLLATFMPKPFSNLTGNGAHFHLSVADAESGRNLFLDAEDSRGLSQLARWFVGGVLQHARALSAIASPIVNSYKRLIRRAPRSGATWAPVYITYGLSNRTQMIRIPAKGRMEVRTVDGAANPYLTCAAMVAAGMDGIANRIDPGDPNWDNLYEASEESLRKREISFLPATLSEAIDALEADPVIRTALGEEFSAYYARVKREEWRQYHQHVGEWERERFLNTY
jgi:glutamine synthetase